MQLHRHWVALTDVDHCSIIVIGVALTRIALILAQVALCPALDVRGCLGFALPPPPTSSYSYNQSGKQQSNKGKPKADTWEMVGSLGSWRQH
jgi:hypothetical protein